MVEPERQSYGKIEDVATIFLTNKECPFRCLMCDLWKNTTKERVPDRTIVTQAQWALSKLPKTKHLKLYNSGSFFDSQAIPRADWGPLADALRGFESVVVETHPRTVNEDCLHFAGTLDAKLQIAMAWRLWIPRYCQG